MLFQLLNYHSKHLILINDLVSQYLVFLFFPKGSLQLLSIYYMLIQSINRHFRQLLLNFYSEAHLKCYQ